MKAMEHDSEIETENEKENNTNIKNIGEMKQQSSRAAVARVNIFLGRLAIVTGTD